MNQLPLNIDFGQILLHLFNVVILFAVLYLLIYKPVKKFMDKRQKEYQDMDEAAEGKVREAEELKSSYEKKLSQAEEEIRTMKSEASKEITEQASEIRQQAMDEAQEILGKARAQAEHEKEKIFAGTGDEVAEIARKAASKVFFDNPSDAYDSFLKKADGTKKEDS